MRLKGMQLIAARAAGLAVLRPKAIDKEKAAMTVERETRIGDKMPDGTIYAGLSPDSGRALYTTPEDEKTAFNFNEARDHAEALDAHGHHDWRVPTKGELDALFASRAVIGGFDDAGCYWSSTRIFSYLASAHCFSNGQPVSKSTADWLSLRCVC
jgi:hypothetical protein